MSVSTERRLEIAGGRKPKVVTPPPELVAALAAVPGAPERWDSLPWYHRREVADYVGEAKRPETRERRAAKAVREHLG